MENPNVKTQIKSFYRTEWTLDKSLDLGTASCRFNNADGNHSMKNTTIISTIDYSKIKDRCDNNYIKGEAHDAKVRILLGTDDAGR